MIDIEKLLAEEVAKSEIKLVVLDDDPTGTQTVHDISVFTDWEKETVRRGFDEDSMLFYILTNSRAMTPAETTVIHKEIMDNVIAVSEETGKDFMIFSRSDSTLRGHYPLETELIRESIEAQGGHVDGEILCPFFYEAGRLTIDDIHYAKDGDRLVPAAETEFAKDEVFGYSHSDLKEYVEEKTGGAYKASDVVSVTKAELQAKDLDAVEAKLLGLADFNKLIINVDNYDDMKTFAVAFYRAMAKGKRYIVRSAASIVKVMGNVPDMDLLTAGKLIGDNAGKPGIVMVGSYTEKTTGQLNEALTLEQTEGVAFDTASVADDEAFEAVIDEAAKKGSEIMRSGKTPLIYTGRTRIVKADESKEATLARSTKISEGVLEILRRIDERPAFIIAKGGVTSSDIATKVLGIRKALVAGQVSPGIPVWINKEKNAYEGIPYIIFPGNVGNSETLKEVIGRMTE